MSIVNEDVLILKTLLDYGANVHERCLGEFFVCEDQKNGINNQKKKIAEQVKQYANSTNNHKRLASSNSVSSLQLRRQIDNIDWNSNAFSSFVTNYEAHCYLGEYPLSFAVCLNLADCFRLLLAAGANPNVQDSNGNTSLHMAVIANKISMLDLCYSSGADLRALNKQNLTPLTLAAKLGRVEMFFHILEIQRVVNWTFCNVCFVDIPIDEIDSIDIQDGSSTEQSALAIVVFGVSMAEFIFHLSIFIILCAPKSNTYEFMRYFSGYK